MPPASAFRHDDPVGKVAAGFFSFTEITDPSEHRAYNEWHQLDHLPEQYPLAGIVAGQRWVSTPACRAARAASGPRLDPVHYLTLYLMAEPVEQTLAEFRALAVRLHQADRFFEHRRALLSGPFDVTGSGVAPRVRVSADAVPFRPTRGIYVVVDQGPDRHRDGDLEPWVAVDGVAGVWRFEASERPGAEHWSAGGSRVTVWYLDRDPLAVAAELAPLLSAGWAGRATPRFRGALRGHHAVGVGLVRPAGRADAALASARPAGGPAVDGEAGCCSSTRSTR